MRDGHNSFRGKMKISGFSNFILARLLPKLRPVVKKVVMKMLVVTKSFYQNSLKAGIVVALTLFTAVAYVNTSGPDNTEPTLTLRYGPFAIERHMENVGASAGNNFIVTAYLPIDEYENRFHGITFTGVPARPYETVAVDPKIVPLGSMIYIEGLGWWRAEDTGNMIIGNRLDICVSTRVEAMRWGKRKLKAWYITPEQIAKNEMANSTEIAAIDLGTSR
jgi:3D (Asp-Asp-Asp) domain-containing protein